MEIISTSAERKSTKYECCPDNYPSLTFNIIFKQKSVFSHDKELQHQWPFKNLEELVVQRKETLGGSALHSDSVRASHTAGPGSILGVAKIFLQILDVAEIIWQHALLSQWTVQKSLIGWSNPSSTGESSTAKKGNKHFWNHTRTRSDRAKDTSMTPLVITLSPPELYHPIERSGLH